MEAVKWNKPRIICSNENHSVIKCEEKKKVFWPFVLFSGTQPICASPKRYPSNLC